MWSIAIWRPLTIERGPIRIRLLRSKERGLSHAVAEQTGDGLDLRRGQLPVVGGQIAGGLALQPPHPAQPAVVGDVRCLGGPGRDGPGARHHQHQSAHRLMGRQARPIAQGLLQDLRLPGLQRPSSSAKCRCSA